MRLEIKFELSSRIITTKGSSGVKREDIFLVTKIWIANSGDEKAAKSIDESFIKIRLVI